MEYRLTTAAGGKLVSSKKGLLVSKEKHRGTGFVNTSVDSSHHSRPPKTAERSGRAFKVRFHDKRCKTVGCADGVPALPDVSSARRASERGQGRSKSRGDMSSSQAADYEHTHQVALSRLDGLMGSAVPPPLDQWVILECPVVLLPAQKRDLKSYLAWITAWAYPLDSTVMNSTTTKNNEPLCLVLSDPLSLRCAMAIGAVCNAWVGRTSLTSVLPSSSQLCSIVNLMLCSPPERCSGPTMAQAVAMLAMLAHLSGDSESWDLHMRGLRQIMIQWREDIAKYPFVRWVAHRTDQDGTSDTVGNPYLPLTRYYAPSHGTMGEKMEAEIRQTLRRHIGPICSCEAVFDAFTGAGCVASTINYASRFGGVKLDSNSLMETFLDVARRLLTIPTPFTDLKRSPVQKDDHPSTSQPPAGHELQTYLQALESSLRLAIMIHVNFTTREIPELGVPRADLQRTMDVHIRVVRDIIREQKNKNSLVNPSSPDKDGPLETYVRPFKGLIIYMCLVRLEKCEGARYQYCPYELPGLQLYRELMELVVGSDPRDVDELPESAFDVYRVFSPRWMTSRHKDPKDEIRMMLGMPSGELTAAQAEFAYSWAKICDSVKLITLGDATSDHATESPGL